MPVPGQLSGYQNEIYLAGLGGQVPPFTTDSGALEQAAGASLAPEVFGYVAGAAGSGATESGESGRVRTLAARARAC